MLKEQYGIAYIIDHWLDDYCDEDLRIYSDNYFFHSFPQKAI